MIYTATEQAAAQAAITNLNAEIKAPIHYFNSTTEAYSACQCDESVSNGDLLIVLPENVVGIAHTLPFAVSDNSGELHSVCDGYTPARLAAEEGYPDLSPLAFSICRELGIETRFNNAMGCKP